MDGRWLVNFSAVVGSGQRRDMSEALWHVSLYFSLATHPANPESSTGLGNTWLLPQGSAQWVVAPPRATGQNVTPSTEQVTKIAVRQTPLCPVVGGTLEAAAATARSNALAIGEGKKPQFGLGQSWLANCAPAS